MGCEWSEWTEWSHCTKSCGGGNEERVREKLPGLGSCDGNATDFRVCDNDACPLENDERSLVMVIGGETVASRENDHSTSIEIIGKNGLCKLSGKIIVFVLFLCFMHRKIGVPNLPEARGKLCAAYDPSGAVIVCGGGERFWRPNANCWQLLAGDIAEWREIPQMYPGTEHSYRFQIFFVNFIEYFKNLVCNREKKR